MKYFIVLLLSVYCSTTYGQDVLYYCAKPVNSGTWQIHKKNLSSGVDQVITQNSDYNYWWVELSPDQDELLLLRSPSDSPKDQFDYENSELVKSNEDGSNQQVIIENKQYGWLSFGNPHWHRDSDRILLFAQGGTPAIFNIYTVDTEGNNPKQLTFDGTLDPNWSADGDLITFIGLGSQGGIPDNFEVFIADYDSQVDEVSNIRQLTDDQRRDHDPCFSPDGKSIAFSSANTLITNADLVTIDLNGSNREVRFDDTGIHGGPLNWGADGRIYHHSIYLFSSPFTVDTFDPETDTHTILVSSVDSGYISPYYAKLETDGLEDNSLDAPNTTIYPNPVFDSFRVLDDMTYPISVRIINELGMMVKNIIIQHNNDKARVTQLPSGYYSYIISNIDGEVAGSFIKN